MIKGVARYVESAKEEAKILSLLRDKDPERQFHIIQLVEAFQSGRNYFMVFEKLGASLFDLIRINNFIGLGTFSGAYQELMRRVSDGTSAVGPETDTGGAQIHTLAEAHAHRPQGKTFRENLKEFRK